MAINPDNLTSFGRLALKLDADFSELTRLSKQIQKIDLDSESSLEHSVKLLDEFARHGLNLSEGIQRFSQSLQEIHQESETATKDVAERAEQIRKRKEHQNSIRAELNELELSVKQATAHLSAFRKDGNGSAADKGEIRKELEQVNENLKSFLTKAEQIKESAGQAKFRSIERDVQNLLDALRTSSRKVDKVLSES